MTNKLRPQDCSHVWLSTIALVLFSTMAIGCSSSVEKDPAKDTTSNDVATESEKSESDEKAPAEPVTTEPVVTEPVAAEPEPLDPTSAAAVAKAALTAYKNKDMATLAEVATQWNKKIFGELAAQGEAHPRYNSIFQGARWDAVQAWDGSTIDARQNGEQNAAVKFLNDEGEELKILVLELDENGHWGFDDINFWEVDRFDALEKIE